MPATDRRGELVFYANLKRMLRPTSLARGQSIHHEEHEEHEGSQETGELLSPCVFGHVALARSDRIHAVLFANMPGAVAARESGY